MGIDVQHYHNTINQGNVDKVKKSKLNQGA